MQKIGSTGIIYFWKLLNVVFHKVPVPSYQCYWAIFCILAILTIKNNFTGEIYEYKLEGRVDDPLAEGMIKIKCNARNSVIHRINFDENKTEEATIFYPTGSSKLDVKEEERGVLPKS